jgi:hypothetical protein
VGGGLVPTAGANVDEAGELPVIIESEKGNCIKTTIFVKYEYQDALVHRLLGITVVALPSGLLQNYYNPTATDTIWRAGRNAPSRGERFRMRLVFDLLKQRTRWRVQYIPMFPNPIIPGPGSFPWDE